MSIYTLFWRHPFNDQYVKQVFPILALTQYFIGSRKTGTEALLKMIQNQDLIRKEISALERIFEQIEEEIVGNKSESVWSLGTFSALDIILAVVIHNVRYKNLYH